jgi:chromosome segregation ATPase
MGELAVKRKFLNNEEDEFKKLVKEKKRKLSDLEEELKIVKEEKENLKKDFDSAAFHIEELKKKLTSTENEKKFLKQELYKSKSKLEKQQSIIEDVCFKLKQCDPEVINKEKVKLKKKYLREISGLKGQNAKMKKTNEYLVKKIYKSEEIKLKKLCEKKINTINRLKTDYKKELKKNENILESAKKALLYYKKKN